MTSPGTIKSIHKRFYSVVSSSPSPRVRSNSANRNLYTAPPPPLPSTPSSRPPNYPLLLSSSRLPLNPDPSPGTGDGGQHHNNSTTGPQPLFSLALSSPQPISQPPSSSSPAFPYNTTFASALPIPFYSAPKDKELPDRRLKTRYQLDVGAYGIAKRSTTLCDAHDLSLAVQVGEDAYFFRDNAMGVADGVGGWARHANPTQDPSPSALFARRLMNFCSAETEAATRFSFHPTTPFPWSCWSYTPKFSSSSTPKYDEIKEQERVQLEELEEGLDVLMILERAYESAIKAHVSIPKTNEGPPTPAVPTLLEGSSTALLAVLDHSPQTTPSRSLSPRSKSRSTPKDGKLNAKAGSGPVLKIAHLGDCMGMLVRGEEIVWRSEEMWWSFNTPVQLGPLSPSKPSTHARTFTLPIEQDDILILASDGLSDNLWDEEVLDEVVRMRKSFLPSNLLEEAEKELPATSLLSRRTLAGMLSEALCSRARRVSERQPRGTKFTATAEVMVVDEVPFARRAREQGKAFRGGKVDDISVVVAVISPADIPKQPTTSSS